MNKYLSWVDNGGFQDWVSVIPALHSCICCDAIILSFLTSPRLSWRETVTSSEIQG